MAAVAPLNRETTLLVAGETDTRAGTRFRIGMSGGQHSSFHSEGSLLKTLKRVTDANLAMSSRRLKEGGCMVRAVVWLRPSYHYVTSVSSLSEVEHSYPGLAFQKQS